MTAAEHVADLLEQVRAEVNVKVVRWQTRPGEWLCWDGTELWREVAT